MLFFVWIRWKSGSLSYYCARGTDAGEAMGAVRTMADRYPPGAADIVAGEAYDLPDVDGGPNVKPQGAPVAFKLRSRSFVEKALYALGILASDLPSPPAEASGGARYQRRGPPPEASPSLPGIPGKLPPAGRKHA